MMRIIWILVMSCLIVPFCFQSLRGETAKGENLPFKVSKNGLEVSDHKKMNLVIEAPSEETRALGVAEERIRDECRLRLAQAGLELLPGLNRPEYLYVKVIVKNHAFSVLIQFRRPVQFKVGEMQYMKYGASTWQKSATGIHGGGPEFVIQHLLRLMDSFLKEYLEANPQ